MRPTRTRDLKMKKLVFIIVLPIILLCACNNNTGNNGYDTQADYGQSKPAPKAELTPKEKFATIESTKKYIENTVWTYTKPGQLETWKKLEFKNGKAYEYLTYPSSGSWGEVREVLSYKLKEERYSDTGEKYIAIILYENGKDYSNRKLDPASGAYIWFTSQILMNPCDYEWD